LGGLPGLIFGERLYGKGLLGELGSVSRKVFGKRTERFSRE